MGDVPDRSTDDEDHDVPSTAIEPYLDLAREIHTEVARFLEDDAADPEMLASAIEAVPRRERARVAREVFDRMPVEVQWSILERAFGDTEIREYLAAEHRRRLEELQRLDGRMAVVESARGMNALDTREIPEGVQVLVGLFRESDARAALRRGHVADNVARRVVFHSLGDGGLRVVEDVFNPRGGLFVTREYDEATWRSERLEAHSVVRIGAGADGTTFVPVIYPGGRADIETPAGLIRGRLHVGFVMLGDIDVFAG